MSGYNKNYISEFPHLMFEKWYLSVVLILISLIMSKNECLLCFMPLLPFQGFSGGSDGKESTCNAGDQGLIPGWGRPLEKEMATHSSILAWRIPWTEEPGRL